MMGGGCSLFEKTVFQYQNLVKGSSDLGLLCLLCGVWIGMGLWVVVGSIVIC